MLRGQLTADLVKQILWRLLPQGRSQSGDQLRARRFDFPGESFHDGVAEALDVDADRLDQGVDLLALAAQGDRSKVADGTNEPIPQVTRSVPENMIFWDDMDYSPDGEGWGASDDVGNLHATSEHDGTDDDFSADPDTSKPDDDDDIEIDEIK